MDPVSITGLVGSIIGITDVVTRTVNKLNSLRARFQNADLSVTTLLTQLYTVRTALNELRSWESSVGLVTTQLEDLCSNLEAPLLGCDLLLQCLSSRLDDLERNPNGGLTIKGKTLFIWNKDETDAFLRQLDYQVNALNLLLVVSHR